nr:hypothetical protein [Kribbella qitaiheensis]
MPDHLGPGVADTFVEESVAVARDRVQAAELFADGGQDGLVSGRNGLAGD